MDLATATRSFRLTRHAIERYRERVKPALSRGACKRELLALAEGGRFMTELPFERYGAETDEADRLPEPDGYIELAPKIFAVAMNDGNGGLGLVTIIIDGGLSRPRRHSRNEAKKAARRAKRRDRKAFFHRGQLTGRPKREWQ